MRFYERALQGRIGIMMSGADSPMAARIPATSAHHIMHAPLALEGGGVLYGGDAPVHIPYEGIQGVSITLNCDTVAEAQKPFDTLPAGRRITRPMQPAFRAKRWGMLVDKFETP